MHSSCTLDSAANLLVRHMVFVGNVQKSPIASHLKGLRCYRRLLNISQLDISEFSVVNNFLISGPICMKFAPNSSVLEILSLWFPIPFL